MIPPGEYRAGVLCGYSGSSLAEVNDVLESIITSGNSAECSSTAGMTPHWKPLPGGEIGIRNPV